MFFIRQCTGVTPISECGLEDTVDTNQLSLDIQRICSKLNRFQTNQETSMKSLKKSFREHERMVIQQMRLMINSMFVNSENEHEQEELSLEIISVLGDFDNRTLEEIRNEVLFIKNSIKRSIQNCTRRHNDLTQFHDSIQKIGANKKLCLKASIKCKHKIQKALTVLGKSDKVFTVHGMSEHIVSIPSDLNPCRITGISVIPDGQVLLADSYNKQVKLLNQQYQVVSHWDMAANPLDICQVTSSEIAVTVDDGIIHGVQFITVKESKLVTGRNLQLQHTCRGIVHHQGDLFVTSGTALFKYSLIGKLVCRLYEDASGRATVCRCAVSPTGDTLYITNRFQSKLLIMARDGTVLATFADPELKLPEGIHVTPSGQVLVYGWGSHTLLQVDSKGRSKLATLATQERDGVWQPVSVCFSSTTSSIIVGQWNCKYILVFGVE